MKEEPPYRTGHLVSTSPGPATKKKNIAGSIQNRPRRLRRRRVSITAISPVHRLHPARQRAPDIAVANFPRRTLACPAASRGCAELQSRHQSFVASWRGDSPLPRSAAGTSAVGEGEKGPDGGGNRLEAPPPLGWPVFPLRPPQLRPSPLPGWTPFEHAAHMPQSRFHHLYNSRKWQRIARCQLRQ